MKRKEKAGAIFIARICGGKRDGLNGGNRKREEMRHACDGVRFRSGVGMDHGWLQRQPASCTEELALASKIQARFKYGSPALVHEMVD
ncbi:hypothetical protein GUJ93_ZPchr0007g4018 [Zizania palustris]|uniref:Uncharacterized protein n=1 Tax=Zizania palustris TaxID=103762 RepID=A0A8J5T9Q6_ZIZPA|nr:hypothetical protein GUJ93_ZPchr0007g4018 [Zizania palustris]